MAGGAGPHDDGGEAHGEGVDEALAVHVVDDDLGRVLVRAVGALRGRRGGVGDDFGEGLAVDGLRGGVDDAHAWVGLAEGEEKVAHALYVDFHGLCVGGAC